MNYLIILPITLRNQQDIQMYKKNNKKNYDVIFSLAKSQKMIF